MVSEVEILDPTAKHGHETKDLRRSVASLSGNVIGFVDNAKPNFNYLVDALAQIFTAQYGVKEVIKRRKRGASLPADKAVIDDLASRCDVVVTGSGD